LSHGPLRPIISTGDTHEPCVVDTNASRSLDIAAMRAAWYKRVGELIVRSTFPHDPGSIVESRSVKLLGRGGVPGSPRRGTHGRIVSSIMHRAGLDPGKPEFPRP